jgi:hypothetical protein
VADAMGFAVATVELGGLIISGHRVVGATDRDD